jgi:hypothetical protein
MATAPPPFFASRFAELLDQIIIHLERIWELRRPVKECYLPWASQKRLRVTEDQASFWLKEMRVLGNSPSPQNRRYLGNLVSDRHDPAQTGHLLAAWVWKHLELVSKAIDGQNWLIFFSL